MRAKQECMTGIYRAKFKTPSFEVELEGPDETIIGTRLNQIISMSQSGALGNMESGAAEGNHDTIVHGYEEDSIQPMDGRVNPDQIADIIHNSKRFKAINNKILKKSNQLYRILLTLHYATSTYGKRGYSTGLLEEITAALGKRLRKSNIAAQIKLHPELFVSDREPGKGVTALYLLTEEGRDMLEDKLDS